MRSLSRVFSSSMASLTRRRSIQRAVGISNRSITPMPAKKLAMITSQVGSSIVPAITEAPTKAGYAALLHQFALVFHEVASFAGSERSSNL
jgi:hypothetical protein